MKGHTEIYRPARRTSILCPSTLKLLLAPLCARNVRTVTYGFGIGIGFSAALRPPSSSHPRARRAYPEEGICSSLTAVTLQQLQRGANNDWDNRGTPTWWAGPRMIDMSRGLPWTNQKPRMGYRVSCCHLQLLALLRDKIELITVCKTELNAQKPSSSCI